MKLFCIDPGTEKSAYVVYNTETRVIYGFGIVDNMTLLVYIHANRIAIDRLVIEMIKSYGNVMGDSTIQTCVWIGRFIQKWAKEKPVDLIPRKTIVTALCGHPRAKDKNVRRALIDHFKSSLNSSEDDSVLGAKGVLHGFKKDLWSALAIAVTWQEIRYDFLR